MSVPYPFWTVEPGKKEKEKGGRGADSLDTFLREKKGEGAL